MYANSAAEIDATSHVGAVDAELADEDVAVENLFDHGHPDGDEEAEDESRAAVKNCVDDGLLVLGDRRVEPVEGDAGRGLDDDDRDPQAEKQQDLQEGVRAQVGESGEKLA